MYNYSERLESRWCPLWKTQVSATNYIPKYKLVARHVAERISLIVNDPRLEPTDYLCKDVIIIMIFPSFFRSRRNCHCIFSLET